MKRQIDLLKGPIFSSLTKLALPIMATSLVQMAYNMTDMIWIGRISSDAVAAVGAAGMYMWLSNGLATMAKMGGQVKVGHALGARDQNQAVSYAQASIWLAILFGALFGLACILFADPLIGFFKLNSPHVIADAKIYLQITCGAVLFSFLNQIFTGIMTAMGNSKTSFFATTIGLVANIILDPIFIFGLGPFPALGVTGAAIATVIAQFIVFSVFLVVLSKDELIFRQIHMRQLPDRYSISQILQVGFPTGIQSMIFTGISMVIARMIAGFGDTAVAVQKVGSQIESISWMTAEGFAAAVNAFVAQNFGADNMKRVRKGYRVAMGIVLLWGTFCTILLIGIPGAIFQIFIPDKSILPMGISYLQILGISQLFMCIEITTAGAFAGLGKTIPPSISGIVFTATRIPMAMVLTTTALGLDGIWWSITISSILKGIVLFTWFLVYLHQSKRNPRHT